MDIVKRKGVHRTFFGIETDRNPLDSPDIIHRTLLVKIGQRDVAALLINGNRRDGRGDLLD